MTEKIKRRKYDIEDVNELLQRNIEAASQIHVEPEACVHPRKWLRGYDQVTMAHLSMTSTAMQWNQIARHLNLYSIILGISVNG